MLVIFFDRLSPYKRLRSIVGQFSNPTIVNSRAAIYELVITIKKHLGQHCHENDLRVEH